MKIRYMLVLVCLFASCDTASKQAQKKAPSLPSSRDLTPEKEAATESKPEVTEVEVTGDDRYIGMSELAAAALAKKEGQPSRVVSVDGQSGIITMDYLPERLNFTVVDGKITKVTRG